MNNTDLEFWKLIFDAVQLIFTVAIGVYVWILSKHKANASRIDKESDTRKKCDEELFNRLTVLETTVKHLPDRAALGNLHKRLDDQSKTLHHMEGQLKGLNDTSSMILEALIKRGEKQ